MGLMMCVMPLSGLVTVAAEANTTRLRSVRPPRIANGGSEKPACCMVLELGFGVPGGAVRSVATRPGVAQEAARGTKQRRHEAARQGASARGGMHTQRPRPCP
jgi:hypothetical protein